MRGSTPKSMSTYTPAGISACDIDVARRNLRKTPPNSPPRPAAKRSPQKQKRVTPRDLELVPVLLCVARVAYVATWPRHAGISAAARRVPRRERLHHPRAAVRGHGPRRGPEHLKPRCTARGHDRDGRLRDGA